MMNKQQTFGRTAGGHTGGSIRRGANFSAGQRQPTYGDPSGYNSMHSMQTSLRGQDKRTPQPGVLGGNPNVDETDEYIVNLQQQIHFMELELKILREKVMEDSAKTGIGSLYDDEKTSHQHISQLKTKYAQMRRDNDRLLQELAKQSLKVKGQEFVLDAQIKVLKEQMAQLKQQEEDNAQEARFTQSQLSTTTKENNRAQSTMMYDVRELADNVERSEKIHFDHKIYQDTTSAFEAEQKIRHDTEVELLTELISKKEKQNAAILKNLDQLEKSFAGLTEYQNALKSLKELREKIEAAKVQVQYLDIQVQILNEQTEFLNHKREDLTEDKKLADMKNDELTQQLRAKQEIESKRLQNKLNREKGPYMKELLANDEIARAQLEDTVGKLNGERENFDQLRNDRIVLDEQLTRMTEELKIDTAEVDEQDKLLEELKRQIRAEQEAVDALEESVSEQRSIKKEEEERNRRVTQQNTALVAKQDFIEANYDYTSTATDINLGIFRDIVQSNADVNETVQGFVGRVGEVKKEAIQIMSKRNAF